MQPLKALIGGGLLGSLAMGSLVCLSSQVVLQQQCAVLMAEMLATSTQDTERLMQREQELAVLKGTIACSDLAQPLRERLLTYLESIHILLQCFSIRPFLQKMVVVGVCLVLVVSSVQLLFVTSKDALRHSASLKRTQYRGSIPAQLLADANTSSASQADNSLSPLSRSQFRAFWKRAPQALQKHPLLKKKDIKSNVLPHPEVAFD